MPVLVEGADSQNATSKADRTIGDSLKNIQLHFVAIRVAQSTLHSGISNENASQSIVNDNNWLAVKRIGNRLARVHLGNRANDPLVLGTRLHRDDFRFAPLRVDVSWCDHQSDDAKHSQKNSSFPFHGSVPVRFREFQTGDHSRKRELGNSDR